MKKIARIITLLLFAFVMVTPAFALPVTWVKQPWIDLDKYHDDGYWSQNAYDDANSNDMWDIGEEWTHHATPIDSDWNVKWANDMTCWMASASNMLSYFLEIPARDIYDEFLDWGEQGDSDYYWTQGGYQHIAVQDYLKLHGYMDEYYVTWYSNGYYSTPGHSGWMNDPYEFAQNELYNGATVGLALDIPAHAITFWGWDATASIVSDSDQTAFSLDRHASSTAPNTWFMDYFDDGSTTTEKVSYLAILKAVPEPGTFILILLGIFCIGVVTKKQSK